MKLSHRLETVASFVSEGSIAADIGTDHGYIPIYLVENGISPEAVAMDVRPGPLKRAKDHIREHGLEEKIRTRLSDGLEKLRPGEADTVIIAGMGGELICRILERGRSLWDQVNEWILSPQSELERTRGFLWENGFFIQDEAMVEEDRKYYTVMRCIRGADGRTAAPGPAQLKYGPVLLKKKDPVLKEFLEQEIRKLETISRSLAGSGTDRAAVRLQELEEERKLAKEAWNEVRRSD